jgi:hypothetical protein
MPLLSLLYILCVCFHTHTPTHMFKVVHAQAGPQGAAAPLVTVCTHVILLHSLQTSKSQYPPPPPTHTHTVCPTHCGSKAQCKYQERQPLMPIVTYYSPDTAGVHAQAGPQGTAAPSALPNSFSSDPPPPFNPPPPPCERAVDRY